MKTLLKKITLWIYIRRAKQIYLLTGKQVFVIPVITRGKHSYGIITNQTHQAYNKQAKKMGKKQISYPELLAMCVFKTENGTTKQRFK